MISEMSLRHNFLFRNRPKYLLLSLREKCPNKEFFLVRIFLHSDWILRFSISPYSVRIQENTDQKSAFGHFSHIVFLTHFWSLFPFYTPWKHQKIFGFLVFSVGIKWEHLPDMGQWHLDFFRKRILQVNAPV